MKKIITILLFSFAPLLPSSGQMVVTDPAHTAANVVGHAMGLTEAIEQGLSLITQLSTLKQVYEQMKAVKETFDKINNYIYEIQSVIDATSGLVAVIQQTSDIYRLASRANVFSTPELISLMDHLTSIVQRATRTATTIKDYITQDKWRFTDKERKDAIDSAASSIEREQTNLEKIESNIKSQVEISKKIDYMNTHALFSPLDAYYANREQELLLGSELVYAFSKTLGEETEFETAQTAAKKTTNLYDDLKKLFFALSGFIALIGAYRVYRKVNLEEDGIGKAAAIWFTSALTVFILGSVVELFLF
jgi:hypothetical protein